MKGEIWGGGRGLGNMPKQSFAGSSPDPWQAPSGPLNLPPEEVHVWRASLDRSEKETQQLERTLAVEERARAERLMLPRSRHYFIVGRGLLRAILGNYLNCLPQTLHLEYSPQGKPALIGLREAKELHFNVAHSNGLVLFAVAWNRAVGVDLEYVRADLTESRIAQRFFSPRENAGLSGLPVQQRREAFYTCWTRKEAYLKARGVGLTLPLDQFDVSVAPGEAPVLLATRDDPQEAGRWTLCDLAPGPGYRGSLAVEGRSWRLWCGAWPDCKE
jgi:4'-phosphopantetheinyl transferase